MKKQRLPFLLALLCFGLAAFPFSSSNMSADALTVLFIFAGSLLLWLFVALDWPSLLCLLALGLIPQVGFPKVLSLSFGNVTFVFLFFTFIVTYALNQTSFLNKMTHLALNNTWVQGHPWRFLTMMLSIFLVFAMIFSPSVLFMFVLPIYEEVCQHFKWEKGSKAAAHLLIACYSTLAIGTAMTPINHVFAITAMGIYEAATQTAITHMQYMSFAVPAGLLLFGILLLSLRTVFPIKIEETLEVKEVERVKSKQPLQPKEKYVIGIFFLMVALWLLPEVFTGSLATMIKQAGIAFPPLVATLFLAAARWEGEAVLKLEGAIKKGVHWPSLLLVAATLALGSVLASEEIGLIAWMQASLQPLLSHLSPLLLLLAIMTWAGLQTNVSSNLVTTSVVGTFVVSMMQSQWSGLNYAVLTCLVGFMASVALMTPPAMPYVAISIGSGWVKAREAFLMGLWLLLWTILVASFVAYPLGNALLS